MLNAPIEKAGGWGGGDQENKLRLIHTRRSSLHFPQWAASMQRQEIFYLPSEMQPSATDARRKCSNVNEPLDRKWLHRSKRRKRGRFESWKANNHRTYVSSTNEKMKWYQWRQLEKGWSLLVMALSVLILVQLPAWVRFISGNIGRQKKMNAINNARKGYTNRYEQQNRLQGESEQQSNRSGWRVKIW